MMATAHVAETSVINCLFQDNLNPEDHPFLNVPAPGFKPFHAMVYFFAIKHFALRLISAGFSLIFSFLSILSKSVLTLLSLTFCG